MLNPFIDLISNLLWLYSLVLLIWVVLSWLVAFQIVNRHQKFVSKLYEVLYKLTEPVLARIRRVVPTIANIDFSPIILLLLIRFLDSVLYHYFYNL